MKCNLLDFKALKARVEEIPTSNTYEKFKKDLESLFQKIKQENLEALEE
jgi:hypothetical protein